ARRAVRLGGFLAGGDPNDFVFLAQFSACYAGLFVDEDGTFTGILLSGNKRKRPPLPQRLQEVNDWFHFDRAQPPVSFGLGVFIPALPRQMNNRSDVNISQAMAQLIGIFAASFFRAPFI